MKKELVIFDFDGVIVDSLQLAFSISKEAMPDLEYKEWQSWFDGNFYKEMREELSDKKSIDRFFQRYNKKVVNLAPIKGIVEVISGLAKKHALVIISSSSEKAINNYLAKYELK